MLLKTITTSTTKAMLLLSALMLTACNGGSSGGDTPSSPGNLVVTSSSTATATDVVVGGTHQYIVTIANSVNLFEPVILTVTSSNNQVATVQSNTCATTGVSDTQSCSFYVNGAGTGSATITVSATNYESVIESIDVLQQWGTFSSEVYSNGHQLSASQLTFSGDYLYAYTSGNVVKSNGGEWQVIGGGEAVTDNYSFLPLLASDDTHICVSLNTYDSQGQSGEVKCSINGSVWQTSEVLDGWNVDAITLYQGNIYVLVDDINSNQAVMYCAADNCTSWQQQGQIFPYSSRVNGKTFFQSTAYLQNSAGTYYQADDGSWQLYGSYTVSGNPNEAEALVANSNGVALMPLGISGAAPYVQQIYYNSSSNIGGSFSAVGGGIAIADFAGYGNNLLAMNGNELFAAPGDDNIYLSTNVGSVWSLWSQVGQNNPPLTSVYVNNNKVYSIYLYDASIGSQIYVYSLD